MKVGVFYWSQTGNTEMMAEAIAEGVKAAGGEVEITEVANASAEAVLACDAIAFGCPAMGDEELDETEFEPFFAEVEGSLSGKKVALFGSYDWGDGEWMRNWYERTKGTGAVMVQEEGLIANNEPDDEAKEACKALGAKMAE